MKKVLLFIVSLPFICMVLIFILFVGYGLCSYVEGWLGYRGSKFDPNIWFSDAYLSDLYETSPRCKMYNDLVKNHLKKGMHVDDVEKLLGKTNIKSYCIEKKNKCLSYSLGICYADSFGISHGRIEVCFDQDNKIISTGKDGFSDKFCDYKRVICFKEECDCYTRKDQGMGEKCPVEIEPW